MKRTFTFMLLTVVAASFLLGCGSSEPAVNNGPDVANRADGKSKVDVANLKGGDIYK